MLLNGYEMGAPGWGRVVYPTWPGQYHVQVFVPYLIPSRVGHAEYSVMVHPGQLVELEYKVPLWTFSGGSLGPPPQKYNGTAIMIGAAVIALAVGMLSAALIIAAA